MKGHGASIAWHGIISGCARSRLQRARAWMPRPMKLYRSFHSFIGVHRRSSVVTRFLRSQDWPSLDAQLRKSGEPYRD